MTNTLFRTAAAALFLLGSAATSAMAQPPEYTFQVLGPSVKTESGWVTTVRLNDSAGHAITNAEVFYRSLEQLNPKALSSVQRRIPLASDGQGDYRLITRQPVRGDLRLGATVPGEQTPLYAMVPVAR